MARSLAFPKWSASRFTGVITSIVVVIFTLDGHKWHPETAKEHGRVGSRGESHTAKPCLHVWKQGWDGASVIANIRIPKRKVSSPSLGSGNISSLVVSIS